jgi:Pin2-interacting protein X1
LYLSYFVCIGADKSKFGYKMLQKMGWKEGKGLGKDEDGMDTHVHIKKRSEMESSLGIGAAIDKGGNIGWTKTSGGFDDILAQLNEQYARE